MLPAARWAALQVSAHAGKRRLRIRLGSLQLDVAVENGEALLAGHFRPFGTRRKAWSATPRVMSDGMPRLWWSVPVFMWIPSEDGISRL